MVFCFVQITQCISGFSLYILVLWWWAALSSDVTLLCIFCTSSSLVLCVPAQSCFSECVSTDSGSVVMCHQRRSAATQTPRVLNKTSSMSKDATVGAILGALNRLALLLGPWATLDCHLYISRSAIFLVCETTNGLLSVSHGDRSHDLW